MFLLKNLKKDDLDDTKNLKFRKEVLEDDAKKVYEKTNSAQARGIDLSYGADELPWREQAGFVKSQIAYEAKEWNKKSLMERMLINISNLFKPTPKLINLNPSYDPIYAVEDKASVEPEATLWEKAQMLDKPTPVKFYQRVEDKGQYYRWIGVWPDRAIYDPKLGKVREMTFFERLRYGGNPTQSQIDRHFR
jgi:hypothetical protein